MAAIITISQPTGAGAGLPGFARKGLWVGQEVQLIDADAANNVSWVWTIDDASTGCTVVIVDEFSPIARITPNRTGTWKITLTVNGGGPGNVQTFVFRVQRSSTGVLVNYGLVAPAYNELPAHANYGGNTRGYAEIWDEIVDNIAATATDLQTQIEASGVLPTREINTSNGLSGGGDLSTNRTISLVLDGGSLQVSETGIRVGVITDEMHGTLTGEGLHQAATSATAGFATALQIQMLEAHEVSILDFGPRIGALETGFSTLSGGISDHETRIEDLESGGGGGGGGSSSLELTVTVDLTAPGEVWTDLTPEVAVPVNTSAYYEAAFIIRRRDTQDDVDGNPYTAVRTYSGDLRVDATRGSGDVLVALVPSEDGGSTVTVGVEDGGGMVGAANGATFEFQIVDTVGGWKLQVRPLSAGIEGPPFPVPGLRYISPETDTPAMSVPVDALVLVTVTTRVSASSVGELPASGVIS